MAFSNTLTKVRECSRAHKWGSKIGLLTGGVTSFLNAATVFSNSCLVAFHCERRLFQSFSICIGLGESQKFIERLPGRDRWVGFIFAEDLAYRLEVPLHSAPGAHKLSRSRVGKKISLSLSLNPSSLYVTPDRATILTLAFSSVVGLRSWGCVRTHYVGVGSQPEGSWSDSREGIGGLELR